MKADILSIKAKKRIIVGVFLSCLLGIGVLLFSITPIGINTFGLLLRLNSGIRLHAKGFIVKPGFRGTIEHLFIHTGREVSAQALIERIDFDANMGNGLKPRLMDVTIHNPRMAFEVKPGSKALTGSPKGPMRQPQPFSYLADFIKKIPYIKKMDITQGTFSIQLPDDMGILKLTDTKVQVREFDPAKGGRIFSKGTLKADFFSQISCSSAQWELSLYVKAASAVLSGQGHLSLTIPELMAKGAILKGLHIDAPIHIDGSQIRIQELGIRLGEMEFQGESMPAVQDIRIKTLIQYDLSGGVLNMDDMEAQLPAMGMIKGDMKIDLLDKGLPWKGSFLATDFLLTNLPEMIAPFLEPGQRGWTLNGRGGAKAELEGRMFEEKWAFKGNLELEVKEAGFNSSDGTKAGEGIHGYISIDLAYPQKGQEKISFTQFKTKGRVQGGEYLWGSIYRDLSRRSFSWDAEGFFLPTKKG